MLEISPIKVSSKGIFDLKVTSEVIEPKKEAKFVGTRISFMVKDASTKYVDLLQAMASDAPVDVVFESVQSKANL